MDEMLKGMGLSSIDDLFEDIPSDVKINGLDLPGGKSQMEVERELREIYGKNRTFSDGPSFLGAGIYKHYVPPAVAELINRSEFYTCYTPYQPELSQGMVQALFEYQSYVAELTGMHASNSSMYDWHTALGEAALMATRINRKNEFIVPKNIHWEKIEVLKNYVKWRDIKVIEVDYDHATGKVDLDAIASAVTENTSGIYFENPNFFGIFEDQVEKIREIAAGKIAMVVGVNPTTLGVLKSPGEYGADMVIGEAQCFGNAPNFGGPLVGIFACKKEHIRRMPGRIIGLTKDHDDRRAFCMTLQTREQHIRRDKATSNICTNEALAAVASSIHMALLGKEGLRKIGAMNLQKAKYLKDAICAIDGFEAAFPSLNYNEFVIKTDKDPKIINQKLLEKGVIGGLDISGRFPELGHAILFCTTEVHNESDHKQLLDALKEVA